MKRLPIGVSSLTEIIDGNYLYIDKTMFVDTLVKRSPYYFLSRPRRFGKSLLVDTIKQAFLGNKRLFKGLYLENNWDWEKKYPVIHIDFTASEIESLEQLDIRMLSILDTIASSYEISLTQTLISSRFEQLVMKLNQKYNRQVVILIDEYDKPILDNLMNDELCESIRRRLLDLYSIVKGMDAYIEFALLTGVLKFSRAGIFSGLNNLDDISLDRRYADICGYTQANIENDLSEYIKAGNVDLGELKLWYNGYNFLGTEEQKVYNPFDLLLFFDKGYKYDCYWFQSRTPSFLIKLLIKNAYYVPALESTLVSTTLIDTFDVDNIPTIAVLFQMGYLTIDEEVKFGDITTYRLKYPNFEVKISLNAYLAQIGNSLEIATNNISSLRQIIHDGKFDDIGQLIASHFASIPHHWYTDNNIADYEGFYASIVYSMFYALGYDSVAEDTDNKGKIDLTIKASDKIVIIEFKLGGSADSAIQQIITQGYAEKYKSLGLPIYMVGISFNVENKDLADYKWELL